MHTQRWVHGHTALASFEDEEGINETLAQLLMVMEHLDDRIGPMLERDGEHFNRRWVNAGGQGQPIAGRGTAVHGASGECAYPGRTGGSR